LLAHRFWLANLFALALIFSKETGVAAYAVVMLAYLAAALVFVSNFRTDSRS
jgi:hypothetical protein